MEWFRSTTGSESGTKEKNDTTGSTKAAPDDSADDIKKMQDDLAKLNISLEGINQQLKLIMGEKTDPPLNVSLVEIMKLLKPPADKEGADIDSRQ